MHESGLPFLHDPAGDSWRIVERAGVVFCEALPLFERGIVHAFCLRGAAVSDMPGYLSWGGRDDDAVVERSWKALRQAFPVARETFFTLTQVHGNSVLCFEDLAAGFPPIADGIVTGCSGRALAIRTADCLPLFLYDPCRSVVAAVHAGWRGTAAGIAGRAVAVMAGRFGSMPADLVAVLGPAIGFCCYEVDEPVVAAMERGGCVDACRPAGKGTWRLDLARANEGQLVRAGLAGRNIHAVRLCTACHREAFFSHRGEKGKTGRHLNFIML